MNKASVTQASNSLATILRFAWRYRTTGREGNCVLWLVATGLISTRLTRITCSLHGACCFGLQLFYKSRAIKKVSFKLNGSVLAVVKMRNMWLQTEMVTIWNMLVAAVKHSFYFEGEHTPFRVSAQLVVCKVLRTNYRWLQQSVGCWGGFRCSTRFGTNFTWWQFFTSNNHSLGNPYLSLATWGCITFNS